MDYRSPNLIVLGGYPGSGKTSLACRLAAEFHYPRLSSDLIGRTIVQSHGLQSPLSNPTWIAYDVVFDLCAEFLQAGVPTILDINMGWSFQWQRLDELRLCTHNLMYSILILHCPRELCHSRLMQRNKRAPQAEVVDLAQLEPRFSEMWQFFEQLNRPDIHIIDAARPLDEVYQDVRHYATQRNI
jgi:predicted kinase